MTTDQRVPSQSPFHAGEIALQRLLGVDERMNTLGRKVVRDFMPDQHRDFFATLPFVAVGAVDPEGDVWASLLFGRPGFASSPDPRTLRFSSPRHPGDPTSRGMTQGEAVGLLGLEMQSRRRNRMNGTILGAEDAEGGGFAVSVQHSFGNCPQYIQDRAWRFVAEPGIDPTTEVVAESGLGPHARAIVDRADTFFVASYLDDGVEGRQVDVSHRGGKPGFIRIADDGTLTIPDFAGNLHFNTLGNIRLNPRVGLLFVDFETGDMLHMTGTSTVILDGPEIAAFQGAERLWTFTAVKSVLRRKASPLRWDFTAFSPNLALTGSWEEADDRLRAEKLKSVWRPFRVTRIEQESAIVRSFYLQPDDNAGRLTHLAGQHLPIRVPAGSGGAAVIRTYTLSNAPSDPHYRISVKREGLVSSHIHDHIGVGDLIEARAPAGGFSIDAGERRPAVLLAAGIGITPILSMVRHIVYEGARTRKTRPTWVFYAARSRAERAFDLELRSLAAQTSGAVKLMRVLGTEEGGAIEGTDYEALGRIDVETLKSALPFNDYDFYLCGPPGFMQSLYDRLRGLSIRDARIHAEAFGPASMKRTSDPVVSPRTRDANSSVATPASAPTPARVSVPVAFAGSGKEGRWTPESGTLLDLAESRGLAPSFSCRSGICGACRTRVVEGVVAYDEPPMAEVGTDEALICCAKPAAGDAGGGGRLILDL